MTKSDAATQMTRQAQQMTVGVGASLLAIITTTIGIILLGLGTFSNADDADAARSAGFYFVGATAILAAIAYTDGVCHDAGEPIEKKRQ